VHIPKFRIGAGKVLAIASTPDFSGTSDIILGYALRPVGWPYALRVIFLHKKTVLLLGIKAMQSIFQKEEKWNRKSQMIFSKRKNSDH
jgi:hypothetical protein